MTLIGVKSKYGSCNGNCTGWIIFNKKKNIYIIFKKVYWNLFLTGSNPEKDKIYIKEGSVCWFTGWAVNSMAIGRRRFDSFSS